MIISWFANALAGGSMPNGQRIGCHASGLIVVSDCDQPDVLVLPNADPVRLVFQLRIRRRIAGDGRGSELHAARMQDVTAPVD